ncbi:DUF6522 family protein [Phaeovulum sp.]|uniref:DUF6522 family protein n=1 Tax=Phaeovulum sp. TaxID=2934796 RepID=UPI0039E6823C
MLKLMLPDARAKVDMTAVAQAFGINAKGLDDAIHAGTVSRWYEVGQDDQDNKPHQIFASAKFRRRVDVDEHGLVHSVDAYKSASANPPEPTSSHGKAPLTKPVNANIQDAAAVARRAHLEELLDEALDESFPASDPVSISF